MGRVNRLLPLPELRHLKRIRKPPACSEGARKPMGESQTNDEKGKGKKPIALLMLLLGPIDHLSTLPPKIQKDIEVYIS